MAGELRNPLRADDHTEGSESCGSDVLRLFFDAGLSDEAESTRGSPSSTEKFDASDTENPVEVTEAGLAEAVLNDR